MKITIKISLILIISFLSSIHVNGQIYNLRDTIKLQEVTIYGKRKIEQIGVTRTKVDSTILKSSICNTLSEVLSQNTTIYIKSYGRGSMSTASFRGTAPSHTQVTWNGMKLNSPMLGMVDFSLIPSYFIDDLTLLHGAGSVDVSDGALGGAIVLTNKKIKEKYKLHFIQGFASYKTYDSYLKFNYSLGKWYFASRIYHVQSENDFSYKNLDKSLKWEIDSKGRKYKTVENAPKDYNKNGEFKNTHYLQEVYYKLDNFNKFSFVTWLFNSDRSLPTLTVNWSDLDKLNTNKQEDIGIRSVISWKHTKEKYNILSRIGYSYNELNYLLKNKITNGTNIAINSRSKVKNIYSEINSSYYPIKDFKITGKINYNLFNVDSYESKKRTGYIKYRSELSTYLAIRYKAFGFWGLSYNIRKTFNNDITSPLINAFLTDFLIWRRYNLILKSSIVKNYHIPTLNDLYFIPGGNPDLKTEDGETIDVGLEFSKPLKKGLISGSATYYYSDIKNWIVWIPTFKGFWEPKNVRKVIAKGIELKMTFQKEIGDWKIYSSGTWGQTISTNYGDPTSWGDESIGKQLIYVPKYSSSLMTKIQYKKYFISHKYYHYSRRFTTSSNDITERDDVLPFIMNNLTIGRSFKIKKINLDISCIINNLFDEQYQSVLKRPMPLRNYNLLISIQL